MFLVQSETAPRPTLSTPWLQKGINHLRDRRVTVWGACGDEGCSTGVQSVLIHQHICLQTYIPKTGESNCPEMLGGVSASLIHEPLPSCEADTLHSLSIWLSQYKECQISPARYASVAHPAKRLAGVRKVTGSIPGLCTSFREV